MHMKSLFAIHDLSSGKTFCDEPDFVTLQTQYQMKKKEKKTEGL